MLIRTPADLGALIRDRRTKLGLDQLSLARQAGTSRKWLIEVENGKSRAEIGLILRTLKALGIVLAESGEAAAPKKRADRDAVEPVNINRIIESLKKRK
jgi:y4mF family transcriptional regulator